MDGKKITNSKGGSEGELPKQSVPTVSSGKDSLQPPPYKSVGK